MEGDEAAEATGQLHTAALGGLAGGQLDEMLIEGVGDQLGRPDFRLSAEFLEFDNRAMVAGLLFQIGLDDLARELSVCKVFGHKDKR